MIYFESLSPTSFLMGGDFDNVSPETHSKTYEAMTIDVSNSGEEPRISIKHTSLPKTLVSMKRFDEISIDGNTFSSASEVVATFNAMMASSAASSATPIGVVRITGDGGTDYPAPSDIVSVLFALNPADAEVSIVDVLGASTLRFAIAPIVGDFPLVVYIKTA